MKWHALAVIVAQCQWLENERNLGASSWKLRIRTAKPNEIAAILLMCFNGARMEVQISFSIFPEKANRYATDLGIEDFHFSNGSFIALYVAMSFSSGS